MNKIISTVAMLSIFSTIAFAAPKDCSIEKLDSLFTKRREISVKITNLMSQVQQSIRTSNIDDLVLQLELTKAKNERNAIRTELFIFDSECP